MYIERLRKRPSTTTIPIIYMRSVERSADFIEKFLDKTLLFRSRNEIHNYTVQFIKKNLNNKSIFLEFGVAGGKSINFFSSKLPSMNFYGFDSFEGLKEDWVGSGKVAGSYSQPGLMPKVNDNCILIKGWIDQTIPETLNNIDMSKIAIVHIDTDTFEACEIIREYVLCNLATPFLVLCDEYLGYPGWEHGEYKSLSKFLDDSAVHYEWLAFSNQQALCLIKNRN